MAGGDAANPGSGLEAPVQPLPPQMQLPPAAAAAPAAGTLDLFPLAVAGGDMMDVDGPAPATPTAAASAAPAAGMGTGQPRPAARRSSKRPRDPMPTFHPGDRVDAMDLEGVWHEAVVKEVDAVQGYRVHFLGWSSRWDEWVEASERIQPAHTKVRNWRPNLRVGDPVEVRSAMYQDRWLSGVVVAVAHEEGLVKCEYSHDARWVETQGEEICLPNTHFSRELDNMSPQKIEQIFREGEVHVDCRAGNAENVKRLVEAEPALVHLKGPLERTPLLIAADHCHLPVLRTLLALGADLRDVDRSNANCLHLAVRGNRERCPEVVKELAAAGALVSARDSRLSTPLHLVAMRGYHDVGMTLIEHGADVNARDMSQVTPLRHAAYRGEEAIVRLLLHFGADPTIPDAQGGKPLEVACYLRNRQKRPVVERLLRDGHIGYLLKKMRQVMMWEAGFDSDRERRSDGVTVRRAASGQPGPRVQLMPPPPAPVMTMAMDCWTQAAAPVPAAPAAAAHNNWTPVELAKQRGLAFSCLAHVLNELNNDMFSELTEYFA